jgi:hypothetical protein
MTKRRNGRVGSSFDNFLKEEGFYEDVTACSIRRVLARSLAWVMTEQGLSKAAMADRMRTSRSQPDHLLDPQNDAVSLDTLVRAARAVGRRLHVELR